MARDTYIRFESPEDYAAYLDTEHGVKTGYSIDTDLKWSGCSLADALNALRNGNTKRLQQAQTLIDKLDLNEIKSIGMPALVPSIAGYVPNVPAAIIGYPESMFRRGEIEQPSPVSPLTVYVETTVSWDMSIDYLVKRGVATLAFVLAMETIRPVDLYCVSIISHHRTRANHGAIVKIASKPMDIARAVWMLTDGGMARRCMFTAVHKQTQLMGDAGPFPFNAYPSDRDYEAICRRELGLLPQDIYMKGGTTLDDLLMRDPLAWIRNQIAIHSNRGE